MALLFWFDQSLSLQRNHILFHPLNLRSGHAAALDIHSDSRQMRRGGLAALRRRIAVVAAQSVLLLDRAHGGVHLQWRVKLFVVGLADVFDEVAGPRTAIAALGRAADQNAKLRFR